MGRPTNTEERRAQIASALGAVMAKLGYDGAAIVDIAKAAKLSPGVIHYHFGSKQEILVHAAQGLFERHHERLAARLEQTRGDARAGIAAFIDFHLGRGAESDPQALASWVVLCGEALRADEVQRVVERSLQQLTRQLAELISEGVKARQLSCKSVDAGAAALIALIQGYFILAATARDVIPKGSAASAARKMAEGLLGAKLPEPSGLSPKLAKHSGALLHSEPTMGVRKIR